MLLNWCRYNSLTNQRYLAIFLFEKIIKKILSEYTLLVKTKYFFRFKWGASNFNENSIKIKYSKKYFPCNYNFEYEYTISRSNILNFKKIFFQFPDGLQECSFFLKVLIEKYCLRSKNFLILGATSYGACCIEDFIGKFVGMCVVLHYGHSCLVPVLESVIPVIYVFLEIKFNYDLITNVFEKKELFFDFKFTLFSTIQYVSVLHNIKSELNLVFVYAFVQLNKPLSPGEILGCTCSRAKNLQNVIYIGDGKFHLEAIMISNMYLRIFQFNHFFQQLSVVEYNKTQIHKERQSEIIKSLFKKTNLALVAGVLGRQGDNSVIKKIKKLICKKKFSFIMIALVEISFDILEKINYKTVNTWAQNTCPRMSTDWNNFFQYPFLNGYETGVTFCFTKWKMGRYQLDYYSRNGGYWGVYTFPEYIFIIKKKLLF